MNVNMSMLILLSHLHDLCLRVTELCKLRMLCLLIWIKKRLGMVVASWHINRRQRPIKSAWGVKEDRWVKQTLDFYKLEFFPEPLYSTYWICSNIRVRPKRNLKLCTFYFKSKHIFLNLTKCSVWIPNVVYSLTPTAGECYSLTRRATQC